MGIRIPVTLSLFLAVGLSSAYGQYKEIYRLDALVKEMPEPAVLNVLSTHLGVPADTLKKEKADNQLSFGELYMAHRFAKATNSDLKSTLAVARTQKPWGEYAKEKNVDMDEIAKDEKTLEKALKNSK
jgi:hypothetical protein